VEPHRPLQAAELVVSKIASAEAVIENPAGRIREQDVSALSGRAYPGGAMDISTDVALFGPRGGPGMDAYAETKLIVGEGTLHFDRGCHRVFRAWKDAEESVALRVDLGAPVVRYGPTNCPSQIRQDAGIGRCSEPFEQAGGALDIHEEQC
jgi:hypothetical protein